MGQCASACALGQVDNGTGRKGSSAASANNKAVSRGLATPGSVITKPGESQSQVKPRALESLGKTPSSAEVHVEVRESKAVPEPPACAAPGLEEANKEVLDAVIKAVDTMIAEAVEVAASESAAESLADRGGPVSAKLAGTEEGGAEVDLAVTEAPVQEHRPVAAELVVADAGAVSVNLAVAEEEAAVVVAQEEVLVARGVAPAHEKPDETTASESLEIPMNAALVHEWSSHKLEDSDLGTSMEDEEDAVGEDDPRADSVSVTTSLAVRVDSCEELLDDAEAPMVPCDSGFDVLSRALEGADEVPKAQEADSPGVTALRAYFEQLPSRQPRGDGFELLDQAQEDVIDGEATEKGLMEAFEAATIPNSGSNGFDVLEEAQDASEEVPGAAGSGFGVAQDAWPGSCSDSPGEQETLDRAVQMELKDSNLRTSPEDEEDAEGEDDPQADSVSVTTSLAVRVDSFELGRRDTLSEELPDDAEAPMVPCDSGFDVLSRALNGADEVPKPDEVDSPGVTALRAYFEQLPSQQHRGDGFDLLDKAQEGVIDGEATEKGLMEAFEAATIPTGGGSGFDVLEEAQDASEEVPGAAGSGFGVAQAAWAASCSESPLPEGLEEQEIVDRAVQMDLQDKEEAVTVTAALMPQELHDKEDAVNGAQMPQELHEEAAVTRALMPQELHDMEDAVNGAQMLQDEEAADGAQILQELKEEATVDETLWFSLILQDEETVDDSLGPEKELQDEGSLEGVSQEVAKAVMEEVLERVEAALAHEAVPKEDRAMEVSVLAEAAATEALADATVTEAIRRALEEEEADAALRLDMVAAAQAFAREAAAAVEEADAALRADMMAATQAFATEAAAGEGEADAALRAVMIAAAQAFATEAAAGEGEADAALRADMVAATQAFATEAAAGEGEADAALRADMMAATQAFATEAAAGEGDVDAALRADMMAATQAFATEAAAGEEEADAALRADMIAAAQAFATEAAAAVEEADAALRADMVAATQAFAREASAEEEADAALRADMVAATQAFDIEVAAEKEEDSDKALRADMTSATQAIAREAAAEEEETKGHKDLVVLEAEKMMGDESAADGAQLVEVGVVCGDEDKIHEEEEDAVEVRAEEKEGAPVEASMVSLLNFHKETVAEDVAPKAPEAPQESLQPSAYYDVPSAYYAESSSPEQPNEASLSFLTPVKSLKSQDEVNAHMVAVTPGLADTCSPGVEAHAAVLTPGSFTPGLSIHGPGAHEVVLTPGTVTPAPPSAGPGAHAVVLTPGTVTPAPSSMGAHPVVLTPGTATPGPSQGAARNPIASHNRTASVGSRAAVASFNVEDDSPESSNSDDGGSTAPQVQPPRDKALRRKLFGIF